MSPGVSTSSSARADIGGVRARTRGWAGAPRVRSERAGVNRWVTSFTTGQAETPKADRVASCSLPVGEWRTRVATPARAKSPWRRASSAKAKPSPGRAMGKWAPRRRSSGARRVVMGPVKKSRALMVRRPEGAAMSRVAFRQAATAGSSAAGSAWARLPQTVPRVRSSRWPIQGRAIPSSGTAAVRGSCSTRRWRTDSRADVQSVVGAGQLVEAGHGVDVDEDGGAAEAHGEDRDQRLAAGQDLALVTGLGQGGNGLVDRGRPHIVERGGLHRLPAAEVGLALLGEGGHALGEVGAGAEHGVRLPLYLDAGVQRTVDAAVQDLLGGAQGQRRVAEQRAGQGGDRVVQRGRVRADPGDQAPVLRLRGADPGPRHHVVL